MSRDDLTPKDTERTCHILRDARLDEIVERAQEKWPGIRLEEIEIGCDHFHARHINYDLYDPSDYDLYLTLTALPDYFERVKTENTSSPAPITT